MAIKPAQIHEYKSNISPRGGLNLDENKMTSFITDPSKTARTGSMSDCLAHGAFRNSPIGKHSFLAEAYIDNAPSDKQGTGFAVTFRERNKQKEIQNQAFSTYSPVKPDTFD